MDDLAQEYEALVQFLYTAPVGLVQASMDGEIVMINPVSAQLLMPLSVDGDLSNLFTALESVAPDLRHRVHNFEPHHGLVCDGLRIPVTTAHHGASGSTVLSLSLVKLDARRLMAVLNDITLQIQRERLLRQNEAWFNAVLVGINDYALARLDAQGRIDEWNPTIGRLTGLAPEAVLGQPFSVLYPVDGITPEGVADRLNEADRSGWSLDEGWRLKADGSRFWGSTMVVPLQVAHPNAEVAAHISLVDNDRPAYCLVVRDITHKRQSTEQHRRTQLCDHLTGLANRRAFFEAGELALERWRQAPRPMALLMLDADHFKRINDLHGHQVGDAALCHLAALLTASFREVDVVARIGGEEFAVLLTSTSLVSACAAAARLRTAVAASPLQVDGTAVPLTLSIGVAAMDHDTTDLVDLLKRADAALYAAKRGGRNQVRVADVRTATAAQLATAVARPASQPTVG